MRRQQIKAGLASRFIRFPVILSCRTLTEYGLAAKPTVVLGCASAEPPLADQHDDLAADDAGKNRTPGRDEACESARHRAAAHRFFSGCCSMKSITAMIDG